MPAALDEKIAHHASRITHHDLEAAMDTHDLAALIRDVPDFPKPGILFKDITTLLKEPAAFRRVIDIFIERYRDAGIDTIAAVESRGFIFGAPLAYELGVAFVPVRKLGKLPAETITEEYDLEYGTAAVELHRDALSPGARVLIVDDLLATGGTIRATCNLIEKVGAEVVGLAFLVELTFLKGRERLQGYDVTALIAY
jgi:adenine phosphoribosyltransferase